MGVVSVLTSECVCGPPPDVPLSAFACLDVFTCATTVGVEAGVLAGVDAIRAPVVLRVVCQFLPSATTTVAGGAVSVVRTPVPLSAEDDCPASCLIKLRLDVPESEFGFEPSPFVSLSAFAFSDRFASAARKLMPAGLFDTEAAAMGEDGVVNKDAIRTPVMLHVACQHLPFAASSSPGGTN